MPARLRSSVPSMARLHSVSSPIDRLARLAEPTQSRRLSTTISLPWTLTLVLQPSLSTSIATMRSLSGEAAARRSRRSSRARPTSITAVSNGPSQALGVTMTTSGPSGSARREASARAILSVVRYWFSMWIEVRALAMAVR